MELSFYNKHELAEYIRKTTDELHFHKHHDGSIPQSVVEARLQEDRVSVSGNFKQSGKELDAYIADIIEKCVTDNMVKQYLQTPASEHTVVISKSMLAFYSLSTDFNPLYYYDQGRHITKEPDSVLLSFARLGRDSGIILKNAYPCVAEDAKKEHDKYVKNPSYDKKAEKAAEAADRQKMSKQNIAKALATGLLQQKQFQSKPDKAHSAITKSELQKKPIVLPPEEKIKRNPLQIKNYKNQTIEMQKIAVENASNDILPKLVLLLKNPALPILKMIIDKNPDAILLMSSQNQEAQKYYRLTSELQKIQSVLNDRSAISADEESLLLIALSDGMDLQTAVLEYGTESAQSVDVLKHFGIECTEEEKQSLNSKDTDKQKEFDMQQKETKQPKNQNINRTGHTI